MIPDTARGRAPGSFWFWLVPWRSCPARLRLPAPVAGAERRIAAYLLSRRAAAHGHSALELTHGTIAIELGSAREVVSRVLKELEREGAVALGRGRIELADLGLLRRLADPGTHS